MKRKAPVYYGVRAGRKTGVYTDWDECNEQVFGYRGAVYKKFCTREEANAFVGKPLNLDYSKTRRARRLRRLAEYGFGARAEPGPSARPGPGPGPQLNAEPEPDADADADADAEPELSAGPGPGPKPGAEPELSSEPGLATDTSSDSEDTVVSVLDNNDTLDGADSLSSVTDTSEAIYDDLQLAKDRLSAVMEERGAVKIVPVSPSHE
ncbi:hypothetical protein CEP54_009652 [Fusarium duplospermum]|uniref:ribonuclease H n=1 Tax=Fusarium duplospermum TaxID=1325734 RepID=A0A428PPK6_9HYPO|nr:hypothetical protein CEP54_009652 [Fusarium duplospermum]